MPMVRALPRAVIAITAAAAPNNQANCALRPYTSSSSSSKLARKAVNAVISNVSARP